MEETKKITRTDFFKAIGYAPHEGQQAVHESDARYRIVTCGRRGGKSKMLAAEAALFLVAGGRVLIVSAYKTILERLKLRIVECLDEARSLIGNTANLRYLVERGAALDTGFPDTSLSGSKGYDLVVSKELWRISANPVGVIIALLTEREGCWLEAGTPPINPPAWYRRIIAKADASEKKWARFAWASKANPSLPDDFMEEMAVALEPEVAKAELSGEIVTTDV